MTDKLKPEIPSPKIPLKRQLLIAGIIVLLAGIIILIVGKLLFGGVLALFGAILGLGAQVARDEQL